MHQLIPLKTPWSIFHLGTQKSNFSLFGELHLYCFIKQNEKEQLSSFKALSTKDLTHMEPQTNPPICQSLSPYRNTDFTARIVVDSGCPFYCRLLHDSKIVFWFSLVQAMVFKTELGPLCYYRKKKVTSRTTSLNESSNLHAQESLSK